MKLVIVESPAKCTTIKRYLGEDYQVMASLGHIRDLATSGKDGLGVDVNNLVWQTRKRPGCVIFKCCLNTGQRALTA